MERVAAIILTRYLCARLDTMGARGDLFFKIEIYNQDERAIYVGRPLCGLRPRCGVLRTSARKALSGDRGITTGETLKEIQNKCCLS